MYNFSKHYKEIYIYIYMFIYLLFILLIKSILSFDINQLNTSVWLSSAAYCNKENILNGTGKEN
jgi:hypothetical protein